MASTQPPSLAAITPLSVLDDATASTLYPGGILNTGFALDWSDERESDSQPYGQGWEQGIVDGGDTECEANQLVRLQNTDAHALIEDNPFYVAELADPIAPDLLVDRINVPVFLAGAWQDEQTGGHFPVMLDRFTSSPALYATMMNGSHTESIANPAIFERMVEFVELYVAKRAPQMGAAGLVGPIISNALTGATAPWPGQQPVRRHVVRGGARRLRVGPLDPHPVRGRRRPGRPWRSGEPVRGVLRRVADPDGPGHHLVPDP